MRPRAPAFTSPTTSLATRLAADCASRRAQPLGEEDFLQVVVGAGALVIADVPPLEGDEVDPTQPCSIRELEVGSVAVADLHRLPLHSLTAAVQV